jgi:PAS domain S-box-containing protein
VKTNVANVAKLAAPIDKIIGTSIDKLFPINITDETKIKILAALSTKTLQTIEYVLDVTDKIHHFEARIVPAEENIVAVVVRDVTDQKLAEKRQKLLTDILLVLNSELGLTDSVKKILDLIKEHTNFYAVGIRLRRDLDYPYFAQDGFTLDFIRTENSIVDRNEDDQVCFDANNNPILVCTCGLVISGKTDPNNPLYTKGGSAWYNGDSESVKSFKDERVHPRNRCLYDGFNSIALIPIKANDKIVGLLQLNDYEKNKLTLDRVEFFERLTSTIGIALIRKWSRESLVISEERFKNIAENIGEVVIELDSENRISFINSQISNVANYTVKDMIGNRFTDYLTKDSADLYGRIHGKMVEGNDVSLCNCVVDFIQKNGVVRILGLQWKIVFGSNGKKKITTYIIARDITEEEIKRRKEKEEDERNKQEVRKKLFSITEDLKSIDTKGKV